MSYTINHYDGSTLVPGGLSDGTYDQTHTSLTLIGKDLPNYGTFLNENFVYLVENFAGTISPSNPLVGQLWWDKTNNILRVWSGSSWKISTGATSSAFSNPPADLSALGGDLWFDNTNSQLKVYSGTSWITVGPAAAASLGDTGAFAASMSDTSSGSHIVIQFKFSGVIYAIFSKDTFTSALTGFTNVIAGLNFSTVNTPGWGLSTQSVNATNNSIVQRDASGGITGNAITASTISVGTITASAFNGNVNGTLFGNVVATTVTATNVTGTGVTASSGFTGTMLTASQPNITTLGNVTNLQLNGTATLNGTAIATVGGPAGFSSLQNTVIGNVTPAAGYFTTLTVNTSLVPAANVVVNIGTPTAWFNNIYGTAIHAQYADLAERFHADAEYAPGTVVEMGGVNEITKVVAELSDKVFGVISTNAAYLMNSSAGNNATHPPIAMSGRVPVRVVGLIAKGDRLVSAGNGLARAGKQNELTPWNVIGRSLVDKTDTNESLIEAIVKINS